MIGPHYFKRKESGVTLLIAIVIATVVLSLGLSIATITTRSFVLSTAVRESQLAYYAGEAGSECARYWGLINRKNFSSNTAFTISCNEESFSWDSSNTSSTFDFSFGHDYDIGAQTFQYPYFSVVKVERKPGIFHLNIDSKGYNTNEFNALRKYERQQNLKAYGICSYRPDIVILADGSSSTNDTELQLMKDALTTFVNTLNPTDVGVHVSIIGFGSYAELHTHLTGDKAQVIQAINNLRLYTEYDSYTNLGGAIRAARAELGNQIVPQTGVYLYCPLPSGPDRVVLTFPNTGSPYNGNLGGGGPVKPVADPQPEIPPGNYDISWATCDSFTTRETTLQPGERALLRLYDNAARTGSPFYTSAPTNDVPDSPDPAAGVAFPDGLFGATTTVMENISITQTARGYDAQHYPNPVCPPNCIGGNGNTFQPLCVSFKTSDGSDIGITPSYYSSYDRPDTTSPDYIIILTDGGSTAYYACSSNQSSSSGTGLVTGSTTELRRKVAQDQAVREAEAARSIGIDIFTVGVGTEAEWCPGYANCSEHLNTKISSYAQPDSPDADGNAFYFDALNYGELDTVLSQIVNCVHPLSGD